VGNIRHFKDLRVWQAAVDAAMRVFEVTQSFPTEEQFSMTDQMRRASRSVATNVAEAWRKRRYAAAFVSKLNDAEAEASELQTWLVLAVKCGYLVSETAEELWRTYEKLLGQLVYMIEHPEDWTIPKREKPDDKVSEAPFPYETADTNRTMQR